MIEKLWKKLVCVVLTHQWTSKSLLGIEPTDEEVKAGMEGFKSYATMYCSRCGKKSKLNDLL